jgi:hypothetical protein
METAVGMMSLLWHYHPTMRILDSTKESERDVLVMIKCSALIEHVAGVWECGSNH